MSRAFPSASFLVVSFLSLVAAACNAQKPEDLASSEDDLTSAPIAPASFLECWVNADTSTTDAFFQVHELVCAGKTPLTYPLRPERYIVEVETATHRVASAIFEGGEKRIGRLHNDDFPLKMRVRVMLPSAPSRGSSFTLKQELTIATVAASTATAPLVIRSPFTLWPVEIKNDTGSRYFVSGRYTVPSKPFKIGANFTIPDEDPETFSPSLFVDATSTTELALVAPPAGALDVKVNGIDAKIDGPGTYVFDGAALTKADDSAKPPPPDASVPTPTCGIEGLAPCAGNVCAPEHRLDANKCVSCGTDGKTFCRDAQGNTMCASGHRFDSSDAKCHICGADGQTFCRDANGNTTCTTGHRFESRDAKCHVCGADGQTFCRDERGNVVCSAGHRYESSDAKCHVCGGDGQTFCRDQNGSTICNPGHRFESRDAKCHVCGGEGQTFCRDTNGNVVCAPGLRYESASATCKR